MSTARTFEARHGVLLLLGACLALVGLAFIHLVFGDATLDLSPTLAALRGVGDDSAQAVIWQLRLPRSVAALVVGGALGLAGAVLQSVLRNPLAAPTTLGVNAGAYLAVVLVTGLGWIASPWAGLPLTFGAALLTGLVVFGVAGGLRASPLHVVLAGVAIAMALTACTAAIQILFEQTTSSLVIWGSGSLVQHGWAAVRVASVCTAVGGVAMLLMARRLDVLALGDETATSLGQRVALLRGVAIVLSILLVAGGVIAAGPVGFVGLVAPNLVRLCGLRRHAHVLLASMWAGAVLLLAADFAARVAMPGPEEIPVGAITALVGGPWLAWMARRARATHAPQSARDLAVRTRAVDRFAPAMVGATVLLAAVLLASICVGGGRVNLGLLVKLFSDSGDPLVGVAIDLRLPRAMMAVLAGAALAVAGVLVQGVVRNPLAAPETLGVTGGASFAALAGLVLFTSLPAGAVPVAAFLGGGAALAITLLIAGPRASGERIALIGIAIATAAGAVTALLVVQADVRIAQALVWLAGSVYGRQWQDVVVLAVWLIVLTPLVVLAVRPLDVLLLGEETAVTLGVSRPRTPYAILLLAAGLAASAVAMVGAVGFVGLVAPHVTRMFSGPRHRRLIPLAAVVGALLLTSADLVGRTVIAPRQIPAGLFTAILGGPYFLWLLTRVRGGRR